MRKKRLNNDESRLHISACSLPHYIDLLRYQPERMSEQERELLYFGIHDWLLHLASKHYGQRQVTGHYKPDQSRQWYEPVKGNINEYNKQVLRVDIAYQFFIESNPLTASKGLIYAFNRRYSWVEMLVELKNYGIELFDETTTISRQINSAKIKTFILGNRLARRYEERTRHAPSLEDVAVEFIKDKLSDGKSIRYSVVARFIGTYSKYLEARGRATAMSSDSLGDRGGDRQVLCRDLV